MTEINPADHTVTEQQVSEQYDENPPIEVEETVEEPTVDDQDAVDPVDPADPADPAEEMVAEAPGEAPGEEAAAPDPLEAFRNGCGPSPATGSSSTPTPAWRSG